MDQVSDTLMRGRIEKMERELDAVERIEEVLEGMIGRMTVTRDLILFEMSKLGALSKLSIQLKEKLVPASQKKIHNGSSKLNETEIISEMAILQNMIGIVSVDDVRKILLKGDRLDQELLESSLRQVKTAIDET